MTFLVRHWGQNWGPFPLIPGAVHGIGVLKNQTASKPSMRPPRNLGEFVQLQERYCASCLGFKIEDPSLRPTWSAAWMGNPNYYIRVIRHISLYNKFLQAFEEEIGNKKKLATY